jgi:hypothetical protein
MRVTIYDKKPGSGVSNSFLALFWAIGAAIQRFAGTTDEVFGAISWDEALAWLAAKPDGALSSIQYWGHGSPGTAYLAEQPLPLNKFIATVKPKVTPLSLVWWRVCSSFQGAQGYAFSKRLADELSCTIAGHTREIGPMQGGLHTRKPMTKPSWPITEAELPKSWLTGIGWARGNNTIFCLTDKIPDGW